jgi:hypothetical protein
VGSHCVAGSTLCHCLLFATAHDKAASRSALQGTLYSNPALIYDEVSLLHEVTTVPRDNPTATPGIVRHSDVNTISGFEVLQTQAPQII